LIIESRLIWNTQSQKQNIMFFGRNFDFLLVVRVFETYLSALDLLANKLQAYTYSVILVCFLVLYRGKKSVKNLVT